jgi:mono/diheme cytochrome c family protein
VLIGLIAAIAGCTETEPPAFRLNMTYVISKQISGERQKVVADTLGAMFGTPNEPYALPETGLDQRKLTMAAGPVWSDQSGGKHGLYRRHCAHCHGISGDGHGPTASILNPYPRDYRRGKFKFKGTYPTAEPSDADLQKIVHDGIPGTAMPSFALLPPDEQKALVEYVKYLSMRGQMERALEDFVEQLGADDKFDPAKDAEARTQIFETMLKPIVQGWQTANEQVIVPDENVTKTLESRKPEQIADSVNKGRELFYGAQANCAKCHGPTALGDGQQDNYDDWSQEGYEFIRTTETTPEKIQKLREDLQKAATDEEKADLSKQIDAAQQEYSERLSVMSAILPPRKSIPRNLREGIYRGGRRPLDLFWRISGGIPGTPMSQGGPVAPGATGTLNPGQIWQIVDYIRTLPYEQASQPTMKGPVNEEAVSTGE